MIEVNSRREGFQPPFAGTRDRTVALNRKGWMLLLDRLEGSGVRGLIESFSGEGFVEIYQNSQLVKNYKVNPDGSFHIILNAGEYEIKSDHFISQRITIGSRVLNLKF